MKKATAEVAFVEDFKRSTSVIYATVETQAAEVDDRQLQYLVSLFAPALVALEPLAWQVY